MSKVSCPVLPPSPFALFVCLLFAIVLPASLHAATYTVPSSNITLTYTVSGSPVAVTITGCNSDAFGPLLIPSTLEGKPVTTIGDWAFFACYELTSVTIPSTVTTIGEGAFYDCIGLSSVALPSSVTTIGNDAFNACSGLTSVAIPSSVIYIGDGAFGDCNLLASIIVDATNPTYASLNGVLFDKAVSALIQAPSALSGIYTLPDSVTFIVSGALKDCLKLTAIAVNAANPAYASLNGVLFDKTFRTLIRAPSTVSGNYTIPSGVVTIDDSAFNYCAVLTTVSIPSSVMTIGDSAFKNCARLTVVSIPSSVTTIGDSAFEECIGITSVIIPSNVTTIGDYAFFGCSSLQSVTFLGNAPTLGYDVFQLVAGVFSFYYLYDNTGFASPTWQGYPAQSFNNTSYTAWHTAVPAYSGLNPEQLALTADPFDTGVPNLLVYALDLNPLAPVLPAAVLNAQATQLVLTFTPARAGIIYQIHASPDLVTWQIIATITTPSDQPITVADTTLISAAEPRRFLRLSVTQ